MSSEDPAWGVISQAADLWLQKRYENAWERLEGLETHDRVAESTKLELQGRCLMNVRDGGKRADEFFRAAVDLRPDNVLAWYFMSVNNNTQGEYSLALWAAETGLEQLETAPTPVGDTFGGLLQAEKGKALARVGRAREACDALQEATNKGVANDGELWRDFGVSLAVCGKSREAFDTMEKAMSIATELKERGTYLLLRGHSKEGTPILERGYEISRSWVALAEGFELSQKWQDAKAAYLKAMVDTQPEQVRRQAEDGLRQLENRREPGGQAS